MKIATYNIWNSENGMPYRENHIIDEILKVKADIICLQEVSGKVMAENIAGKAGYEYCFFDHYENEEEGLCILSKVPFKECDSWLHKTNAIYASFESNDKTVGIVNLHLPWDSVAEREREMADIVDMANHKKVDSLFLAGDFNCTDTSDVQRFLTGECLLSGNEAKPRYYDLALAYSELVGKEPEYTLDFRKNPRFQNNTIELNARFDRILLRNTYPREFPVLRNCVSFGQTVYEDIWLAASDHYGVVVEVDFVDCNELVR